MWHEQLIMYHLNVRNIPWIVTYWCHLEREDMLNAMDLEICEFVKISEASISGKALYRKVERKRNFSFSWRQLGVTKAVSLSRFFLTPLDSICPITCSGYRKERREFSFQSCSSLMTGSFLFFVIIMMECYKRVWFLQYISKGSICQKNKRKIH